MDALDRPSKRRRTGTYATRRTTLNTAADKDPDFKGSQNSTGELDIADPDGPDSVKDTIGGTSIDELQAQDSQTRISPDSAETASKSSSTRKRRLTERAREGSADATSNTRTRQPRRNTTAHEADGADNESPSISAGNDVDKAGHNGEDEHDDTSQQPRSSGRTRRRPRRFSPDPEPAGKIPHTQTKSSQKPHSKSKQPKDATESNATAVPSPQPKGILTPSRHGRNKRTGARKSVVFDADEQQIEEQLGFKDISESSKSRSKSKSKIPKNMNDPSGTSSSQGSTQRTHTGSQDAANGADSVLDDDNDEDDGIEVEPAPNVDDILSLNNSRTLQIDGKKEAPQNHGSKEEDAHITKIKTEVLSRIAHQSLSTISSLQTQYDTLHSLLAATITAGESNSLLLLGSRGSGKSMLISHALAELSRSHSDDFHVVRLDGFFQTDDKLALREIWRQLGREMAVSEDETGEVTSYADTMASLLSLLSHPEELAEPDTMMHDSMHPEEELNKTAKSVIFILDEFDLFTTHPRQTLLYNLFDIAQARKAPIAVIGCSTRMDVVDCLEKRVKSRFSHRWLHIPGVRTLRAFEDVVLSALVMAIDGKEALGVSKDDLDWRQRWNTVIKVSPSTRSTASGKAHRH